MRQTALADSSLLRYTSFTALYIAQGLPGGLLGVAFSAWLAEQGLGTAEIGGFLAVIALPWSLKLVWGPLMDRFTYLPMGRRRPWIVGAQLGLVGSCGALSLVPDPVANLGLLSAIGFVVSLFATASCLRMM